MSRTRRGNLHLCRRLYRSSGSGKPCIEFTNDEQVKELISVLLLLSERLARDEAIPAHNEAPWYFLEQETTHASA